MKILSKKIDVSELQISLPEFLKSYNKNIPAGYPQVTAELLQKFKTAHASFFRHGELWSLDEHRKKIVDWLQLNKKSL